MARPCAASDAQQIYTLNGGTAAAFMHNNNVVNVRDNATSAGPPYNVQASGFRPR